MILQDCVFGFVFALVVKLCRSREAGGLKWSVLSDEGRGGHGK